MADKKPRLTPTQLAAKSAADATYHATMAEADTLFQEALEVMDDAKRAFAKAKAEARATRWEAYDAKQIPPPSSAGKGKAEEAGAQDELEFNP